MASHRMPDEDRPRRPVPAWVTAPPESAVDGPPAPVRSVAADGLEARPASVASTSAPGTVAHRTTLPGPQSPSALGEGDIVVPDYPPEERLLPPAPTSPAVDTVPFVAAPLGPAPVSPADAVSRTSAAPRTPAPAPMAPVAPAAPVSVAPPPAAPVSAAPVSAAPVSAAPPTAPGAPAVPVAPAVGQPRFSVPGLEHVVVEGVEPEPVGPIGYRTPARFARQQASLPAPAPTPTRSFDAVVAAPAPAAAPRFDAPARRPNDTAAPGTALSPSTPAALPSAPVAALPTAVHSTAAHSAATTETADGESRRSPRARPGRRWRTSATSAPSEPASPEPVSTTQAGEWAGRASLVRPTPGATLGAVAGLATLGLAAWWLLQPSTVHGIGLVLGVVALLVSVVTLRNRAATWQRPIALLGTALGGVGTLVLLWAVASAVLPVAGVTLPDLTGTGVTPTLTP